jgi:hypothetical protein
MEVLFDIQPEPLAERIVVRVHRDGRHRDCAAGGVIVVELGGPTMFARIGVMKALNRGHVREFNPSRKEPHWGRRKLARDR